MDSLSILELSHLSVIFSLLRRSVRLQLINAEARLTWPRPEPSVNILWLEVGSLKWSQLENVLTWNYLYWHRSHGSYRGGHWSTPRLSCTWWWCPPPFCSPIGQYHVTAANQRPRSSLKFSCTDITSGVSIEMRSMHMLRQIFLASSQPTWK